MKTINSLFLLLGAFTLMCAQQAPPKHAKPTAHCHGCVHRLIKRAPSPTPVPPSQNPAKVFVGEARVDVTKDETVVRLAMAQHGSVLIELPANDGPRHIIPGDPEMVTVDLKALEQNKRAIVMRPGTQFVPPRRTVRARVPAATVTTQMRSGLVVTFLFYPVEDLAQNVHRCVLRYNRDDVVARRRAAGLPVNLDSAEERGEMTAQSSAPISNPVDIGLITKEEKTGSGTQPSSISLNNIGTDKGTISPKTAIASSAGTRSENRWVPAMDSIPVTASALSALLSAIDQPKQFKKWTKPVHGLAISVLQPKVDPDGFTVVAVAIRNKTPAILTLLPDDPALSSEMLDERGKLVSIESIKRLHTEASVPSGFIPPEGTVYYAIAYRSPPLNVRQQVKLSVGQSYAADEPASIILAKGER